MPKNRKNRHTFAKKNEKETTQFCQKKKKQTQFCQKKEKQTHVFTKKHKKPDNVSATKKG